MKLKDIIKMLENFAPLSLAESWDNVGLLIDPCSSHEYEIKRALLTIDLTENVVEEATSKDCSLVISYHPPIFKSFKRLLQNNAKDRIIMKCIARGITVYSPHTCWDSVDNGVNDWIGSCFANKKIAPIAPHSSILDAGMGRILTLSTPLSLTAICDILKSHLGIKHVRVGHKDNFDDSDLVKTIAICAGSGGSLLNGVDADIYITGEMSHHDVLAAISEGRSVILSEHTHTERGFLKSVVNILQDKGMGNIEFIVSEIDSDPLKTIS